MKRTTISLPDHVQEALGQYQRAQEVSVPLSKMAAVAIQEYLARRGYGVAADDGIFRMTPATRGSGVRNISADHDRYFVEVTASE